jgi:hypothetical protein
MNQVVARFRDGRILKGTSLNVDPTKPTFHVRTKDGPVEVVLAELKALFFVKDHTGNAQHQEAAAATPGDARLVGGHKLAVKFQDGEIVVGLANRFPPLGKLFFMIPIDPKSNNIRILVNREATVSITQAAESEIKTESTR